MSIPECGDNRCGEFVRYDKNSDIYKSGVKTTCNYLGVDNISPENRNGTCPMNHEYHS